MAGVLARDVSTSAISGRLFSDKTGTQFSSEQSQASGAYGLDDLKAISCPVKRGIGGGCRCCVESTGFYV